MPNIVATTMARIERYDTIVIGAGQAGLAVGYHLMKTDADFLILDASERIGNSWRHRWDSLRVFTSAAFTALPGMPFPAAASHLPHKDELADYLEHYACRFDLPVRTGTRVLSVRWAEGRYTIDAGTLRYEARNVVIATGPFQVPRIPDVSRFVAADILQLHSSAYRNPLSLPDGPVLVVGVGNAGARIALELSRFHPVTLAGPKRKHLWRSFLGRDIHWWLWPAITRLHSDTWTGRWLRRHMTHDPMVGISETDFRRAGVQRCGRVTGVRNGRPMADGIGVPTNTIVWCTGFAPDFRWIKVPFPNEDGAPLTERGVVREMPGLYFVGHRFLHTLSSALMGGVGADAAHVAWHIRETRAD